MGLRGNACPLLRARLMLLMICCPSAPPSSPDALKLCTYKLAPEHSVCDQCAAPLGHYDAACTVKRCSAHGQCEAKPDDTKNCTKEDADVHKDADAKCYSLKCDKGKCVADYSYGNPCHTAPEDSLPDHVQKECAKQVGRGLGWGRKGSVCRGCGGGAWGNTSA